jgi:hypothetical protein
MSRCARERARVKEYVIDALLDSSKFMVRSIDYKVISPNPPHKINCIIELYDVDLNIHRIETTCVDLTNAAQERYNKIVEQLLAGNFEFPDGQRWKTPV